MVFGGLDRRGVPLGDTLVLKPNERGFSWETIELQPSPVPRFVFLSSPNPNPQTKLPHHPVYQYKTVRPEVIFFALGTLILPMCLVTSWL